MATKILIEWPARTEDGQRAWNRVKVQIRHSMKGNLFVEHNGQIYVFRDLQDGVEVVSLVKGQGWVPAGRVTYGVVFLGSKDELSYEEWLRSPEGRAYCEEFIKNMRMGMV